MNTDARIKELLDKIYSDDEIAETIHELGDPSLLELAADEADSSAGNDASADNADDYEREAREILRRITATPAGRTPRLVIVRKAGYWAAAAITLLLIAVAAWRFAGTSGITNADIEYAEIATSYGETKEIRLADGTSVTLNSCSRLQYPLEFQGDTRQVRLSGEAFFAVARNEDAPFIVSCSGMAITVLGTEFDVKAYESDMTAAVSVQSGKVRVELNDAVMNLHADQQLTYDNRTHDFDRSSENRLVAAWRNGELTFNRSHMADVAAELERTFNCRITFRDGVIPDNRITGTHRRSDLDDVLRSLEYISGIHYSKGNNGEIVLYR